MVISSDILPAELIKQILADPLALPSDLDITSLIRLKSSYRAGFRAIFMTCAGLAGLAVIMTFFLVRQVDLEAQDSSALDVEGKARGGIDKEKDVEQTSMPPS